MADVQAVQRGDTVEQAGVHVGIVMGTVRGLGVVVAVVVR